jgi:hypothetical protein
LNICWYDREGENDVSQKRRMNGKKEKVKVTEIRVEKATPRKV